MQNPNGFQEAFGPRPTPNSSTAKKPLAETVEDSVFGSNIAESESFDPSQYSFISADGTEFTIENEVTFAMFLTEAKGFIVDKTGKMIPTGPEMVKMVQKTKGMVPDSVKNGLNHTAKVLDPRDITGQELLASAKDISIATKDVVVEETVGCATWSFANLLNAFNSATSAKESSRSLQSIEARKENAAKKIPQVEDERQALNYYNYNGSLVALASGASGEETWDEDNSFLADDEGHLKASTGAPWTAAVGDLPRIAPMPVQERRRNSNPDAPWDADNEGQQVCSILSDGECPFQATAEAPWDLEDEVFSATADSVTVPDMQGGNDVEPNEKTGQGLPETGEESPVQDNHEYNKGDELDTAPIEVSFRGKSKSRSDTNCTTVHVPLGGAADMQAALRQIEDLNAEMERLLARGNQEDVEIAKILKQRSKALCKGMAAASARYATKTTKVAAKTSKVVAKTSTSIAKSSKKGLGAALLSTSKAMESMGEKLTKNSSDRNDDATHSTFDNSTLSSHSQRQLSTHSRRSHKSHSSRRSYPSQRQQI